MKYVRLAGLAALLMLLLCACGKAAPTRPGSPEAVSSSTEQQDEQKPDTIQIYQDAAQALMEKGDYSGAAQVLEEALAGEEDETLRKLLDECLEQKKQAQDTAVGGSWQGAGDVAPMYTLALFGDASLIDGAYEVGYTLRLSADGTFHIQYDSVTAEQILKPYWEQAAELLADQLYEQAKATSPEDPEAVIQSAYGMPLEEYCKQYLEEKKREFQHPLDGTYSAVNGALRLETSDEREVVFHYSILGDTMTMEATKDSPDLLLSDGEMILRRARPTQ